MQCRKSVLVFINTYSKTGSIMKNMVIDDRLPVCRKKNSRAEFTFKKRNMGHTSKSVHKPTCHSVPALKY